MRLLVEAAWHRRRRYTVTKTLRDRWDLAPAAASGLLAAGAGTAASTFLPLAMGVTPTFLVAQVWRLVAA